MNTVTCADGSKVVIGPDGIFEGEFDFQQWHLEADALLVDIGRVIGKHERNGELIEEIFNNEPIYTRSSGICSNRESVSGDTARP